MTPHHRITEIAEHLGVEWSSTQLDQLVRYEEWLRDEAAVAGGIGPAEHSRLFDRHIADSLMFLTQIDPSASSLVDVGSGVGLPAIPIAIVRPELNVAIIDRAERRTRLAMRALRILGLDQVTVDCTDVASTNDTFDVVTFRASLPIAEAATTFQRLANPDGVGVIAWSRREHPKSPPEPPSDTIFTTTAEGVGVLDSPAWLVRMQRSQ